MYNCGLFHAFPGMAPSFLFARNQDQALPVSQGTDMSEQPSGAKLRLLVGFMIGASVALIGLAGWMHVRHVGTPRPAGGHGLGARLALRPSRGQGPSQVLSSRP